MNRSVREGPALKPVAAEDAATVILVRDADQGIEVYMTRRQPSLMFLGGYHVFPGGKVDEADRSERMAGLCPCLSPEEALARIEGVDDPARALGFFSAAAREVFEEAGVLLATDGEGRFLDDPPESLMSSLARRREELQADRVTLAEVLEEEGLALCPSRLLWFAHWVTPATSPRRFNTYFFLARKPEGQRTSPFEEEVAEAGWVKPAEGLARWRRGEWKMIPPTFASLDALSGFGSWEEVKEVYSRPPEALARTVWKGV